MNNFENFSQGPVSRRAQEISILGSLVLLFIVAYLVRKGYLKSGYSIVWFFIAVSIFIMSLFTDVLFWFSKITGIDYAPAAIFSVLIVGIILIAIHFSVIVSKHERKIKKLAQENALLKEKLERKRVKVNKA